MLNHVMFQAFEWETEGEGFYARLMEKAPELVARGVDSVWLPPVYKASSVNDQGYGTYDLYDLGEFDQKGTVRTKYGTKEELLEAIRVLHEHGIRVYADVVINHKAAADEAERCLATPVNPANRHEVIGETREIEAWTGFSFPGRGDTYSDFKWSYVHFTGIDYDNLTGEKGIYRIEGENKGWALGVSPEHGNYDYLMFADIDHNHPDVREELLRWAQWFVAETGVDGFRMDAVKHIDDHFMREFTRRMYEAQGEDFYIFGEYWQQDKGETDAYLEDTDYLMDLFDVPLHFNMQRAAQEGKGYDLRRIFDGSIVAEDPFHAVTFVDNHDTQPGQSLESWVDDWFKPLAYGLILLRKDGYPCIFAGDYYGLNQAERMNQNKYAIDRLLFLRKALAWGEQTDYLAEQNLIGWVRHGTDEHPNKLAVVLSTGEQTELRMEVGTEEAGRVYMDYLDNQEAQVTIDDEGFGVFPVGGGSLSAWAEEGLEL